MERDLRDRIEAALGVKPVGAGPLSGGCIGEVYRVTLDDGREVVAKVDSGNDPKLDIEAYMLDYLATHSRLPVPGVLHAEPRLLVMEFLAGDSRFPGAAQVHAADLLAELHAVRADRYGLDRDTLIGGLHQPNPWTESWIDFFRDQRLLHMARCARDEGRMGEKPLARIENFAARLGEFIEESPHPSLLHGDVWTTNVLAQGKCITGFVDPAVYYGHPEIELAFITLFNTFSDPFFSRYNEHRPIAPGFFETRRDIYNLYPLLVHVRLFGGSYLASVESTLSRFGF